MIIGFDAKRFFHNFSGLGNYSRTLIDLLSLNALDNTYRLYTPKVRQHALCNPILDRKSVEVILPQRSKLFWRSHGMTKQFDGLDIYHGLSHELPIGIQKTKVVSVVTIHDLIYYLYPQDFPWIDRKIYDYKFRHACRHADHIIAISESTKQDIQSVFGIAPDKISVIYQPISPLYEPSLSNEDLNELRQTFQLPEHFNIYVGSTLPRKNLSNVLLAHASIPKNERIPLVLLAGGNPKKLNTLKQQFDKERDILFLGHVDFSLLPGFYKLAEATLYPSRYEGFGLPIVESLKMGTPVITSDRSSLPEAGGPGALYVDPDSVEEIATAMLRLSTDRVLYDDLVVKGQNYILKFDAERYIQQIIQLYESMLAT